METKKTFCRGAPAWIAQVVLVVLLVPLWAEVAGADSSREPGFWSADGWTAGLKCKRFSNSHTSFEFGNPFAPILSPLSRLEFPLDTWWGGVEVRAPYRNFVLGLEVMRSRISEAEGLMRDTDWEDEENPLRRTTYSESSCRIEPSWTVRTDVELKVRDLQGIPEYVTIRPVIGLRWQRFRFMTHDGVQFQDGYDPELLAGNTIGFEQTYRHYFLGLKADLDLADKASSRPFHVRAQWDWAYVEGKNRDHHLLREGRRLTYENTFGQAHHGLVALTAGLSATLALELELDHLWLSSGGSHRLLNDVYEIDLTFNHGVRVWSRQTSLSLALVQAF